MHIQLGIPTSLRNKPPSAGKTVHALNRRSLLKRKRRNLDESRTSRVHSFDVFDTCLVRVFLRPRDLFLELSARVLKEVRGPGGYGAEEISELARCRVDAAARAEAAAAPRVATLAQIYDHFPELSEWNINPDHMQAMELELEAASVRPIASTKRRIQLLRAAGERIVFASDMYLPQNAIQRMLLDAAIAAPGDPVYVSSELGVNKRSGDLFRLIMEREGVEASKITHLGDSLLGDYIAAKRAGVRAELCVEAHPTRYELAMAAGSDPWVSSRIAGISRATRLAHVPDEEESIPGMGTIAANIVAPLLTGFVLWVLQEARKEGTQRLYFVARDGQVLFRIAQAVADHLPTPELRYLYGSRQAWYLPSVHGVSHDDLSFAVLEGQSRAPRHMLRKLGLTPEQIAHELTSHGFPADSWDQQLEAEAVERFRELLRSTSVAPLVLAAAKQAREPTVDYFRQEGLLDDDRWSLVDIGWTLRTQASLARILKAAGQDHVQGYYLGISRLRFSATEYGRARGCYVEEVEDLLRPSATPIFENKGFIDDILIQADHGPTVGYQWHGDAVCAELGPVDDSPRRLAMLSVVQTTVAAFAAELGQAGLAAEVQPLQEASRITADMFFAHPTREDVRAVRWASLSPDPNQDRSIPLVRKLGIFTLLRIARDLLRRARRRTAQDKKTVPKVFYKDAAWGFSWLEGSVAISGPPAKLALLILRITRRLARNRQHFLAAAVRKLQPVIRR